jgi:hypothetical protein
MSMVLMEAIGRADIVIAVFGGREESVNVLFELGVALGLRKPTLIIAPQDETNSPDAPTGIAYLRADPDDSAALEFGLAQFLAAPPHSDASPKPDQKETRPLGPEADTLLARLRANHGQLTDQHGKPLLQDTIVQALRASGISRVSLGEKHGDARIDIAVWSNDLEPWVRNPLLIQVKNSLPGKGELDTLVRRFANAWGPESVNWALVIYREAAPEAHRLRHLNPHILLLSAEEFLVALKDTAFGDLIRKLRNERVHGKG